MRHRSDVPEMTSADVLEVLDLAAAVGAELWVDGGWAVDALLGEQTRKHDDLDILIERRYERPFADELYRHGFRPVERADTRPWNYVLGDDRSREVDFHVIERRTDGDWDYGPEGGPPQDVIPGDSLLGKGSLAIRTVRCLTAAAQVGYHTGYTVDANDWADVRALCERFELPVPSDYASFRGARGEG